MQPCAQQLRARARHGSLLQVPRRRACVTACTQRRQCRQHAPAPHGSGRVERWLTARHPARAHDRASAGRCARHCWSCPRWHAHACTESAWDEANKALAWCMPPASVRPGEDLSRAWHRAIQPRPPFQGTSIERAGAATVGCMHGRWDSLGACLMIQFSEGVGADYRIQYVSIKDRKDVEQRKALCAQSPGKCAMQPQWKALCTITQPQQH